MKNWETLEADLDLILDLHYTPGRSGRSIDHVVIHHNGGTLSAQGVFNVWQTREASAHYQVDINGVVSQHVWDSDTAWHAADFDENCRSIAIEHANAWSPSSPISEATLDNGAHLTAALCKKYGLGRPRWHVNVWGHRDFHETECPGHLYHDQLDAYMARAGHWYDVMTGAAIDRPQAQTIAPAPKPKGFEVATSADAAMLWEAPSLKVHRDDQANGVMPADYTLREELANCHTRVINLTTQVAHMSALLDAVAKKVGA